jgi:hypothetical protein
LSGAEKGQLTLFHLPSVRIIADLHADDYPEHEDANDEEGLGESGAEDEVGADVVPHPSHGGGGRRSRRFYSRGRSGSRSSGGVTGWILRFPAKDDGDTRKIRRGGLVGIILLQQGELFHATETAAY